MSNELDRRALLRVGGGIAATGLVSAVHSGVHAEEANAAASSAMPAIEVYAASPFVDQIAISPDGTRCALVTQEGDEKYMLQFRVDGQAARRVSIGPVKIRGLFFGDNAHVILVNSVTKELERFAGGKNEFSMARSINLDTAEVITFFSQEAGFYAIVSGNVQRIKVDGEYRITASNYFVSGAFKHCLYSFGTDKARGTMIHEGSEDTERWILTPDGRPSACVEYDDDHKTWKLLYNNAESGKPPRFKEIYSVRQTLDYPSLAGLGRDGTSLVLRINSGDNEGQYHEISPDGVLGPPLDQGNDERSRSALFHPVTRRLAGFAHQDDWFSYDYFDPLMKKIAEGLTLVMGDEYRCSIEDFAEDPRKMIVYGESADDAGSYYLVDFSTGDVNLLASNYPDLPAEWITQKTAIKYKAADGLEIGGYLTLPPFKAAKDLPLIVLPHGGPQARDYIGFDWQTQVLASRGYAVLQPNFRGSSGYSRDFIEKGHGQWGRKMQTDLSDGVRWLASEGTIDPKRVAILGASYGGYAALAGATLDPDVYRCAVSIAGVSDPGDLIRDEIKDSTSRESRGVLYWKRFLGDQKTYDDISPLKQATKAYCPILLIHGSDDVVVPIDHSRRMEKALKAAGKPVEFVSYKGQDHWETVGSHRIEMMKTALAFLQKHNPA